MTRLSDTVHADHPWRIHELAGDFRLEDVWTARTPGAKPNDFPTMLAAMQASAGPAREPLLSRFLFAVRWKLGALMRWDKPEAGIGARVPLLRDRLPRDLAEAPRNSDAGLAPLTSVYELDNECALERASRTVHMVMHLGWAPTKSGGHEFRVAVLVKPNGPTGRLYMAAITPFRRLIVFPALTRQWEHAWRDRGRPGPEGGSAATVDSAVGTHNIPESIRALSSLPHVDYADVFTLCTDVDADTTPEQWARAMFGDVPSVAEQLIWRGLLGLRLSRGRSPDTVAGWQIAERGEDWIRLEAASWFLTGNLLVQATDGRVSLGTFLRYDRRLGHAVWPPLSAVHRRLAPGLLRDAAAIVRATRRGNG
ncbi:DUF2867 domain-containing protein [Streptomyces sp. H27-D2]|uniref:DUF2867 domain-containing protein n=1 Tax=Streptomyces sp. H27-D2 TaxID=3046304 RepID=UPI002DB5DA61|nr:DUF2867 domain-containing protein [Streptomyces sp. H27-D2]MEC4020441.1 DUF2867 domain-containing protein [Streptomyces sp. H27-D2]